MATQQQHGVKSSKAAVWHQLLSEGLLQEGTVAADVVLHAGVEGSGDPGAAYQ